MPFIASTSPQIQIFRDVLDTPIAFPQPAAHQSDGPSSMPHAHGDMAIVTADTMALGAYTLFAKSNYRIEFDGQPADAMPFIANGCLEHGSDGGGQVPKEVQCEKGRQLLEHLQASLIRMYPDSAASSHTIEHAFTVAAILAAPEFWHAEATAMSATLGQKNIRLPSRPSLTTVRVWRLEDGSGWGMQKVMHWHSYTDGRINEVRHMDDGGPILTVDKISEISFDAVQSFGDSLLRRPVTEYRGEARATLCHVGWGDPKLDLMLSRTDPDTGAPVERTALQHFASFLFSLLADAFGLQGIRYVALPMADLDKIIEARGTIPSPVPGADLRHSVGRMDALAPQRAVKRLPGKERHYAACQAHDVPAGVATFKAKDDGMVQLVPAQANAERGKNDPGVERPTVLAMLSMARRGSLSLHGASSHMPSPRSSPRASSGSLSRTQSPQNVFGDDVLDNDVGNDPPEKVEDPSGDDQDGYSSSTEGGTDSDEDTGISSYRPGKSVSRARADSLVHQLQQFGHGTTHPFSPLQRESMVPSEDDVKETGTAVSDHAVHNTDAMHEQVVMPPSLFTPHLTDAERLGLQTPVWRTRLR